MQYTNHIENWHGKNKMEVIRYSPKQLSERDHDTMNKTVNYMDIKNITLTKEQYNTIVNNLSQTLWQKEIRYVDKDIICNIRIKYCLRTWCFFMTISTWKWEHIIKKNIAASLTASFLHNPEIWPQKNKEGSIVIKKEDDAYMETMLQSSEQWHQNNI